MRVNPFLTGRMIRTHFRQYIGFVLCASLFFSALLTVFLYRDCAEATFQKDFQEEYGTNTAILYNVNPQRAQSEAAAIRSSGSGIIRVTRKLAAKEDETPIYFGSMDENALKLRSILLSSGRFPKTSGEIAVEENTLAALGGAKLGESVTLTFSDGETPKSYRLVGVLKDYIVKWQGLDGCMFSVLTPPPTVITVPGSGPVLYEHVVCAKAPASGAYFGDNLGGKAVSNIGASNSSENMELAGRRQLLNMETYPLMAFFVVVTVFGLMSLVQYAIQARENELRLLRNLGMKRSRRTRLYYFQGLVLFLPALLLSLVISPLFCMGMTAFYSFTRSTMAVSFRWQSFLFAGGLNFAAAVLVLIFQQSALRRRRKAEQKVPEGRHGRRYRDCAELWGYACRKQNRSQRATTAFLVAFCTALAAFGAFQSYLFPYEQYDTEHVKSGAQAPFDYRLYVVGGSSSLQNYGITLPRKMGVSEKDLETLSHTEGLQVNNAEVSSMTSQFFLMEQNNKNKYLQSLPKGYRNSHIFTSEETDAVRQAGGKTGDCMVKVPVRGLNWDSVLRNFPSFTSGALHKEQFLNGSEILAPDTSCKVGDTFTMITPLVDDGAVNEDISGRVTFHVTHVTVAATYHPGEDEVGDIVLSGEYIMKIDPSARYDVVELTNLQKDNAKASARIEQTIARVTTSSRYVTTKNQIRERQDYVTMQRSMQMQTAACVFAFLIIVLLAFAFSISVDVETNLRSYLLMRSIGARWELIRQMLWKGLWGPIWKGTLAGTVPLTVLIEISLLHYRSYPRALLGFLMLGAAGITFGLICALAYWTVQRVLKNSAKLSVMEGLSSSE